MKKMITVLAAAGLVAAAVPAFALSVTASNNGQALANAILGGGITATNVSFTGSATSAGAFTGGGASGITIDKGILLTSGSAPGAVGPNNSGSYTGYVGTTGDANLNSLIPGYTTYDKTVLEFDFTSAAGSLFFNYVFGSEEYNEYVGSSFNDVFGFFLDGVNIALIPGTSTPVSINNVNLGSNSSSYINNSFASSASPYNIQYDGFTKVFQAQALNLAAGTHHIKLAIADAGDSILDSGVFIQGGSFSDTPVDPGGTPVPEPSTMLLLGGGLAGLAFWRKRKQA